VGATSCQSASGVRYSSPATGSHWGTNFDTPGTIASCARWPDVVAKQVVIGSAAAIWTALTAWSPSRDGCSRRSIVSVACDGANSGNLNAWSASVPPSDAE
jgi:hypothetical protein